jgi:hypothetical protein
MAKIIEGARVRNWNDVAKRLDELSHTAIPRDDDDSVPTCYPACREVMGIARELVGRYEIQSKEGAKSITELAKERDAALLVAKLALEAAPPCSLDEIRDAFAVLDKVR